MPKSASPAASSPSPAASPSTSPAAVASPSGVASILAENSRRIAAINAPFDPITGEGSVGERTLLEVEGLSLPRQYIPKTMMRNSLVRALAELGSVDAFIRDVSGGAPVDMEEERRVVNQQFFRIRIRHDFPFFAASLAYIKGKGGGDDILFTLNRPQRRLVHRLEKMRLKGKPIRLILLKARQWGGSTCVQIYMIWLQLTHQTGLNSLIVGHVKDASTEVKDMFDRLINSYPLELLHEMGESYDPKEPKMVGVGQSGNIHRIPARNFKIKIGSAVEPNSARGGDYNLVHCTEVGLWKKTEGKTPEDIIRSACSGVLLKPYTMIVYESTANGTGNFFHREYSAAKEGKSQFEPLFIAWYDIDQYTLPVTYDLLASFPSPILPPSSPSSSPSPSPSPASVAAVVPEGFPEGSSPLSLFASWLISNRESDYAPSNREEPGRYLWWLWNDCGATLEAIAWYIVERSKYTDHGQMASEFPSDDEEAFVHSGSMVFDKYKVNAMRTNCRAPRYIGEVSAEGEEGEAALTNIHFTEDRQGLLHIWSKPEIDPETKVLDRYLVVVDIGGRGTKADWSVITVFDRLPLIDAGKPIVVAQWYGHIDMDLLAWKAAQIAKYYDDALLVIESNTLETHDRERQVDGDQSAYILTQVVGVYDNLYARPQSDEDVKKGEPKKYGFHTNISTKPAIISTLIRYVRDNLYVERDERCLDEYLTYEKKPNGAYGAISGKHDDLLMTRAIGLHISTHQMEIPAIVPRHRAAAIIKPAYSAASI